MYAMVYCRVVLFWLTCCIQIIGYEHLTQINIYEIYNFQLKSQNYNQKPTDVYTFLIYGSMLHV